ncbi:MAG: glutaredoxin family protein [Nitrospinota bacterium]
MDKLRVYSAKWCPDCTAAKRVLDEKNIEYENIDIEETPESVETIIKFRGKRVLPTLVYKDRSMDGNHFSADKFEEDLKELLAD